MSRKRINELIAQAKQLNNNFDTLAAQAQTEVSRISQELGQHEKELGNTSKILKEWDEAVK